MKHKILLTLFIVCFISAVLLSFIPTSNVCGLEKASCFTVANSGYEKIMGVNNSYIGIVAFLSLIIVTISHMVKPKWEKELILTIGVVASSIIAIYFLYLQFFVIGAICKYCLVVDLGSILALIVIMIYWKK